MSRVQSFMSMVASLKSECCTVFYFAFDNLWKGR
jgi:hypothetical protein